MSAPTHPTDYLNLDLLCLRTGQGFEVRVINSPVGEARGQGATPFTEEEITAFWQQVEGESGPTPNGGTTLARTVGARLFEAIFDDEIGTCYRRSLDEARRQGQGLRLRLRIDDPALARWPWEYLFDSITESFVALSPAISLARYFDVAAAPSPTRAAPPLILLVVLATPIDLPALDVAQEWALLEEALAPLVQAGRLLLERLQQPTPDALRRRLRRGPCHIVHFVGHGGPDPATGRPLLFFEDAEGGSSPVDSTTLGLILQAQPALRLVVLNACRGSQPTLGALAGVAQGLVQQGVPALIAMQSTLADEAALAFAHDFYGTLADGEPVDRALAEARRAMALAQPAPQWGAPTLLMRAPDGALWGSVAPPPAVTPPPPPAAWWQHIPAWRWQAGAAILLPLLLAAALWLWLVPARMPVGDFNIAVAPGAEVSAAGTTSSARGATLDRWLVGALTAEQVSLAQTFGLLPLRLWHDGLPPWQKRSTIGVVAGATAPARHAAAEARATALNANVLLSPHIATDGAGREALVLEFYVRPDLQSATETTIGHFQFGDPIPLPAGFDPATATSAESGAVRERLTTRARALAWLIQALDFERLGQRDEMLRVLDEAERRLPRWAERGEGKEILHTLRGEALLDLVYADQRCTDAEARTAEAEAAFAQALASAPTYFYALVGRGNVHHSRAQCALYEWGRDPAAVRAELDEAFHWYQRAAAAAEASPDREALRAIARLALAPAYRLRGAAWLQESIGAPADDAARAREAGAAALNDSLAVVAQNLVALADTDAPRTRAKSFLAQGNAYDLLGWLQGQLQNDGPGCVEFYESAQRAYDFCIAEGERAPLDTFLTETIVAGQCAPYRQAALCTLGKASCPPDSGDAARCPASGE